jgi:hypothetical protein
VYTGQCPVHQRTTTQTRHLREFPEALRYNSPDCPVYTGQCPVLQGSAASGTRQPREITSAAPLKFTGLSGEPRSNGYLRAKGHLQAHSMRARAAQSSGTPLLAHQTMNSTCPVCTGHPGGPRSQKLQRSESNGSDDVAGAPDCPVYTGQCPVLQGSAASGTRQPREITSAAPLKFTGLSGVHRTVR